MCDGSELSQIEPIKPIFDTAVLLAQDIGCEHLWIDVLCSPNIGIAQKDAIIRMASMIIVIGGQDDETRHFICPPEGLSKVRSWFAQHVRFAHIQTLGHGAYGVF